jgi:anti-sigma factor RsiW
MGKAEDQRLQRYFDGELTAEERAAVERSLSDDDRLRLAALGELHGLVANSLTAEAAEIDLWPALEKKLPPPNDLERARLRRWMRAHMTSLSAGITAMAAAAALLFFLQPWHARSSPNDCDVLNLETSGAVATVFDINDVPHQDGSTTVIWTEEQD